MKIVGFQKLSMVDYPNKMAAIIFTEGCNFRCPWCHNSALVYDKANSYFTENEIFDYLKKREGIIDALVVSGGEPTLQRDLKDFLKKLRNYKVLIKLDSNGSNPKLLKELIDEKLVDYIAMDIKNIFKKYDQTTGMENINISNIKRSIDILKEGKVDYEFRTTIVKQFHTIEDIKNIYEYVKGSKYYLQNFKDNENVLYDNFTSFSEEELKKIKELFPDLIIRGLA